MNPSALRTWLVELLAMSVGDATVDTHFPGDRNLTAAMVWCGEFRPAGGTDVREMRAGAKGYQHLIEMDVFIQARTAPTPADAEAVVWQIWEVLEAAVAANVVPYDGTTPLAYHAVLGDWTLRADWIDTDTAAAEIKTSIRFHIDT